MNKILNFQMCHQPGTKHRKIGNTATISPELELGQGVFHCVLKPLCYVFADTNKLTPNIQEVMAFSKWLSAKQNLRKVVSLKSVLYSFFRPLKQILP
jgi:hypothetical protein